MVSAKIRADVLREFSRFASDILDAGHSGVNWVLTGTGGACKAGIFARTALAGADADVEFVCLLYARVWLVVDARPGGRVSAVLLFQRNSRHAFLYAMAGRKSADRKSVVVRLVVNVIFKQRNPEFNVDCWLEQDRSG